MDARPVTSSGRPERRAVWSGAAIVNGVVYWGSGYDTRTRELPYDGDNDKLYAFTLDARRAITRFAGEPLASGVRK